MKKEIELIITKQLEQNSNADIDNCSNGGGYFQPHIEGEIEFKRKKLKFILNDTSCGHFGARYTLDIYDHGSSVYYMHVDYVGNREAQTEWSGHYQNVLDWVSINTFLGDYIA